MEYPANGKEFNNEIARLLNGAKGISKMVKPNEMESENKRTDFMLRTCQAILEREGKLIEYGLEYEGDIEY
jgi:hypothetical protein